jgi:hypothetical protein
MKPRRNARCHDKTAIRRAREGHDGALDAPASRMSTGLTSTELAGAGGARRVPKGRRSRHAWRDLLEQLQPFPAHAALKNHETSDVADHLLDDVSLPR